MGKKFSIKNLFFMFITAILIIVLIGLNIDIKSYKKFDITNRILTKLSISQNIAPQRLFVKIWRITRNSYIDNTLNGQNWAKWRLRYLKHIKTMEDANVAINSMLASLNDPYTKFLLSDGFSKQMLILDSKITGIGLILNKTDKGIIVNHTMENSPAQNADILAGDMVVSINGQNATKIDWDDIFADIEAGKTKKVEITFKRNNQLITKELIADNIPVKTMKYKITKDNIGIITLSNIMGDKAINDFKAILEATNKTKGIIIDLRDNYGGRFINAIQMTNYMLDIEEIVSIDSRINKKYQIYSAGERVFKKKPTVILINKKTASAAEILAGSLKDNNNAILVGENSFGKNTIQQVIPLANKTGLIITTDKYILPSGEDINKIGLIPTIKYPAKKSDKDEQMEFAEKLINGIVKK